MHDVHADPAAAEAAGHDEVEVLVAMRYGIDVQVHDGIAGFDEVEASVQQECSGSIQHAQQTHLIHPRVPSGGAQTGRHGSADVPSVLQALVRADVGRIRVQQHLPDAIEPGAAQTVVQQRLQAGQGSLPVFVEGAAARRQRSGSVFSGAVQVDAV